jgi:solute carrier family 25 folate transporter 32
MFHFAAGAASKILATAVTYPHQVIKARMQQRQNHLGPELADKAYIGFINSAKRILRNEGFRGFYNGFSANLLRVAPQSAITLVFYEQIVRFDKQSFNIDTSQLDD